MLSTGSITDLLYLILHINHPSAFSAYITTLLAFMRVIKLGLPRQNKLSTLWAIKTFCCFHLYPNKKRAGKHFCSSALPFKLVFYLVTRARDLHPRCRVFSLQSVRWSLRVQFLHSGSQCSHAPANSTV